MSFDDLTAKDYVRDHYPEAVAREVDDPAYPPPFWIIQPSPAETSEDKKLGAGRDERSAWEDAWSRIRSE